MFGEKLRKLREDHNLTQAELSKILGVTRQAVSNYETGREPSYAVLVNIAYYFDVSTDYLTGKSDYKNAKEEYITNELSGMASDDTPLSILLKETSLENKLLVINMLKPYYSMIVDLIKRNDFETLGVFRDIFYELGLFHNYLITNNGRTHYSNTIENAFSHYVKIKENTNKSFDTLFSTFLSTNYFVNLNSSEKTIKKKVEEFERVNTIDSEVGDTNE